MDNWNTFAAYSTDLIPEHPEVNDPQVVAPSAQTGSVTEGVLPAEEYIQLLSPELNQAERTLSTFDLFPLRWMEPQAHRITTLSGHYVTRTDKKPLLHLTSPPRYHYTPSTALLHLPRHPFPQMESSYTASMMPTILQLFRLFTNDTITLPMQHHSMAKPRTSHKISKPSPTIVGVGECRPSPLPRDPPPIPKTSSYVLLS